MTLWESRSGADGGSPLPATGRRPCARGLLGGRLAPIGGGAGGAAARLFGVAAVTPRPRWVLASARRNPPPREGAGQWPDGETPRALLHREGPLVRREKRE